MTVSLVWIHRLYKLKNVIFANFKPGKYFFSFTSSTLRNGTLMIYCGMLLIEKSFSKFAIVF